jgi:hypothetical protein
VRGRAVDDGSDVKFDGGVEGISMSSVTSTGGAVDDGGVGVVLARLRGICRTRTGQVEGGGQEVQGTAGACAEVKQGGKKISV